MTTGVDRLLLQNTALGEGYRESSVLSRRADPCLRRASSSQRETQLGLRSQRREPIEHRCICDSGRYTLVTIPVQ